MKYVTVSMFSRRAKLYHSKGYKIVCHSPFSDSVTFEIPKKKTTHKHNK